LASEEASLPSKTKTAPKAGAKKKAAASSSTITSAGAGLAAFTTDDPLGLRKGAGSEEPAVELGATGVEQMLEALEVAHQKTDKQSVGAKAGLIEQHPEVRGPAIYHSKSFAMSLSALVWGLNES